jgi:hypothetical protein
MIWQRKNFWQHAGSTIEYLALTVFILGAIVVFQKYILHAFWGQWKKAGDVFSFGKQYDPRAFGTDGDGGGTLECMFVFRDKDDPNNLSGDWVIQPGYDECMLTPGQTQAACIAAWRDVGYCAKEL